MLSFLKKLFGFGPAPVVEAPAFIIQGEPPGHVVVPAEAEVPAEAPAKKPRAKKPAAPKAPRAKKPAAPKA